MLDGFVGGEDSESTMDQLSVVKEVNSKWRCAMANLTQGGGGCARRVGVQERWMRFGGATGTGRQTRNLLGAGQVEVIRPELPSDA